MSTQQKMTPIYSRPVIMQELYDLIMVIDNRQEAFIEDHGYSNPRLQGLSNAVLNFMGIFGLIKQPLKSLNEQSKLHTDKTLQVELQNMFRELQIYCDGLPKVVKMTRAKYETEFEGLIALTILKLMEQNYTLRNIEDLNLTEINLISLKIGRTYSNFDYLQELIKASIKEEENKNENERESSIDIDTSQINLETV